MVVAGRALSNYGGIFDPDPYPAFEGTPADTAGVLCNTRDEFIRETRRQCKRGVDLIKIADSTWGDVQTVADDEIAAVVDEAHRHNVKVTIHSRGSTSTRAAAKAGVDLIYHADLATQADLDIIAKAGMPIAPVLTSPWIGVAHDGAGRGLGDRVRDRLRAQLETSFQMIRNARPRHIGDERQRHRQRLGLQPWALARQGGGVVRQGGRCAGHGGDRRQHERQCLAHGPQR